MSSIVATREHRASTGGVEVIHPLGGWAGPRVESASSPPRIVRSVPEDDLGPARGIGLALIAGTCMWVGLVWGAVTLVSRFL